MDDILKRLKEVKDDSWFLNEMNVEVVVTIDDFEWFVEQVGRVEQLNNELNGYKLSNQSLSNSLDKEIKENERLRKDIKDMMTGYDDWDINFIDE